MGELSGLVVSRNSAGVQGRTLVEVLGDHPFARVHISCLVIFSSCRIQARVLMKGAYDQQQVPNLES